ncbi:hypothetical protein BDV11DRAFT_196128 [Aspergillus similis]
MDNKASQILLSLWAHRLNWCTGRSCHIMSATYSLTSAKIALKRSQRHSITVQLFNRSTVHHFFFELNYVSVLDCPLWNSESHSVVTVSRAETRSGRSSVLMSFTISKSDGPGILCL